MKRTIGLILSWALAVLCAVGIFLFSSQNGADSAAVSSTMMEPFYRILTVLFGEQGHTVFRKFAHFFIFAALMFFVYHALYRTRRRRRLSAVLPFVLCVLYAVSDEVHQFFVPERACRAFDVCVDAFGCVVGGLCFYCLAKICLYISQKRRKKKKEGVHTMKKLLSILLVFCLAFSLSSTAFAAKTCDCGHAPVIYVRGFGAPLYESQTNEKIYPPEKEDFKPVMAKIVFAAISLLSGFYRAFADLAMQAAEQLFEKLPCDETGVPIHASNIRDEGLPSTDRHKSGSLWSYSFPYDWREDPLEVAKQLNDYVERVEQLTGHSQVSFICHSMGSVIFSSYLALYGSDDVDTVVFIAPAFQGVSIMGSLLSGEAKIGNKSDETTAFLLSLPMLTDARLVKAVRIGGKLGVFKLLLKGVLQPALNSQFERVFRKFLRPTFAHMPGIWSFVSSQYYERAKAFSFGADTQYTDLIRRLDRYHYGVQTQLVDLLRTAQDNGMKMAIISGYGISSMPLSYEHTMQSDVLITTKDSSIGAVSSPYGETLPLSHVQSVEDGHDHVSADKLVDASTCAFPEQTWFVRGLMHFDFPYENEAFYKWLFNQTEQPTVQTNALYPQFMQQVGEDLVPVTE